MFHAKLPTRPSADTPRASSTPPRRRVRSAHSPYVMRSLPEGVFVTTSFFGNSRSARWKKCGRVSGYSSISPCMA